MTVAPLSIDAWPFLITRRRTVGQRTMLAPGLLISTGRHVDLKAVSAPVRTAGSGPEGRLLGERGDLDGQRARVDAGDHNAAIRLARLPEQPGELDGLMPATSTLPG
jgi:hypothetical protein